MLTTREKSAFLTYLNTHPSRQDEPFQINENYLDAWYVVLHESVCYLLIFQDDVVAQTKIIYQEKELLQLIHSHLSANGLSKTASMLQQEANLPKCSTPPPNIPSGLHLYSPGASRLVSTALKNFFRFVHAQARFIL